MIRNEAEYQEASARLADERQRLAEHRARLTEAGLGEEEIKRVIDPMESFHLQLKEEVESYERLKRGEFEELENFRGFGPSADFAADCKRDFAARAGKAAFGTRVPGVPRRAERIFRHHA